MHCSEEQLTRKIRRAKLEEDRIAIRDYVLDSPSSPMAVAGALGMPYRRVTQILRGLATRGELSARNSVYGPPGPTEARTIERNRILSAIEHAELALVDLKVALGFRHEVGDALESAERCVNTLHTRYEETMTGA